MFEDKNHKLAQREGSLPSSADGTEDCLPLKIRAQNAELNVAVDLEILPNLAMRHSVVAAFVGREVNFRSERASDFLFIL